MKDFEVICQRALSPPSLKQRLREYIWEEQGSKSVVQFQRLVKSVQRLIKAGQKVLVLTEMLSPVSSRFV